LLQNSIRIRNNASTLVYHMGMQPHLVSYLVSDPLGYTKIIKLWDSWCVIPLPRFVGLRPYQHKIMHHTILSPTTKISIYTWLRKFHDTFTFEIIYVEVSKQVKIVLLLT